MSSVSDAAKILNEDTGIFAFLPAANFVFVVVENQTDIIFTATVIASITSAIVYNLLSGEAKNIPNPQLWLIRLTFLVWVGLLVWSMYGLIGVFHERGFIPEILFFISVVFLSLLLSDAIFREYVDEYASPL